MLGMDDEKAAALEIALGRIEKDYGKGAVTVYQDVVNLEQDFEVGPVPKFQVYLVPKTPVTPDDDIAASMYVDLGRLRAFKGSQVFPILAGIDLTNYPSVVVWCERFGVLISPAIATIRFVNASGRSWSPRTLRDRTSV